MCCRRRAFKRKQRGKIGLALNGDWYEAKPAADLGEQRRNEKAAERALEFSIGWFARPVYQGDYPSLMRERCGNRLPRFTADQRNMLVGSADFFGLNHYSRYVVACCCSGGIDSVVVHSLVMCRPYHAVETSYYSCCSIAAAAEAMANFPDTPAMLCCVC